MLKPFQNHLIVVLIFKAPFTRSAKNFIRRAYFCFLEQTFERKKFSAYNKTFSSYIRETKNARRTKFFTLRVKKLKHCLHVAQKILYA